MHAFYIDTMVLENVKKGYNGNNLRNVKWRIIMCGINFKKPEIEDVNRLRDFLSDAGVNACDYTPANLYLWSEVYNTEIAYTEHALYIRYMNDGEYYFSFPIAKKRLKEAFDNLMHDCERKETAFQLGIVEPWMFEIIDKLYPGQFKITYNRDSADYVYSTELLAALAGKKYHGKKNHINKFKKTYEKWTYESINRENCLECIEMVKSWGMENDCFNDRSKADEMCIMIKGIKHMEELSMKGGLIRIGDKVAAVTLGEPVNDKMFVIHFEKAFANIQGAYPMINQQFILHELMDYEYVNREEDMGLEGLRKAKESYNPEFMVQKGVVTRKDG